MVYPRVGRLNIGGVSWGSLEYCPPTSQILQVGLLNPNYWEFSQCNPGWSFKFSVWAVPRFSSSLLPADVWQNLHYPNDTIPTRNG